MIEMKYKLQDQLKYESFIKMFFKMSKLMSEYNFIWILIYSYLTVMLSIYIH